VKDVSLEALDQEKAAPAILVLYDFVASSVAFRKQLALLKNHGFGSGNEDADHDEQEELESYMFLLDQPKMQKVEEEEEEIPEEHQSENEESEEVEESVED
jgi:hypothetical protein